MEDPESLPNQINVNANELVSIVCTKIIIRPSDVNAPLIVYDDANNELAKTMFVSKLFWDFGQPKEFKFKVNQNCVVEYE